MAQKILLKRSTAAGAEPTLEVGEIAVNVTDGKLFIGKSGGNLTFYDLVLLTSTFAKLASPAFTGNPTAPTQALSDSSTRIANTAFVKGVVDAAIEAGFSANDAMMFKGGVASNAGLPTTHFSAGWTYKVTAAGTYAGQACSVGDTIICIKDNQTATAISPTAEYWMVVQANVEAATASTLGLVKLAANPGLSLTAGALAVVFGTAANTVCQGNDSRLSNARTPTAHASTNKATYGAGTSSNYGHVRLSDDFSDAAHAADDSVAASQWALATLHAMIRDRIRNFGVCSTAAATAAKVTSISGSEPFQLLPGARVVVKFTVTNSAGSPTLNVNSTGAKPIFYRGSAISAGYLAAGRVYEFVYDGTNYELIGDLDTNTTYSVATTGANGLMSAADKTKLNGIAAGANAYSHPNSGVSAGTYKSVTVNAAGHVTGGTNPTTLAGYGITDAAPKAQHDLLYENRFVFDASRSYGTVDTLAEAIALIPETMYKRGLLLSFQDNNEQHLYQWNYPGDMTALTVVDEYRWKKISNPDIDGGLY